MMNLAASYVMALGYDPKTDCVIDVYRPPVSADGYYERQQLKVMGRAVFELETTSTRKDYVITFTVVPKCIGILELQPKENPNGR